MCFCFLLRLVFGLRSYSLRHFRVWSPGSRQGCLSRHNQKWRPRQIRVNSQKQILQGFMANRIEIAETNPPGFYGKSNSIGRLLNWDKGAAGRKRFLNVLTKKCLKRGKQRNVDRGHTNGTLNKWTKMFLHFEEKLNSLFNHLILIGIKWGLVFVDKTWISWT